VKKHITSFYDLEVYQRSYKAAIIVIKKIIPELPPEEKYGLSSQLRRSSKVIPRLIVEGYSKKTPKERISKIS